MKIRIPRPRRWAAVAMAATLTAIPLLSRANNKSDTPGEKPEMYSPDGGSPMHAEQTVAKFKIAPGLEASVWAAEPDLVKPTNMDIDSRGRIWVTEGANYRSSKTRPEGDRIVILEDSHHTGKADSAKVFAQDPQLFAPLGIAVLGNKVIVDQSPNMLVYTIDASGDKPVGPPEVIFTGFSGVNHDHGLHSGIFGPDGRYYFNSGNEGMGGAYVKFGNALSQHDGKPVVDITGSEIGGNSKVYGGHSRQRHEGYKEGMAFAMNLDGSDFEVLGNNFRNNYELTVDSYGTVWQSDNDDDGNQGTRINYVMEGGNFGYKGPNGSSWNRDRDEYIKVFPHPTKPEAHWHLRWPGVVPNLLNTGQGSPCGITIYEGDLLPELYQGALLHCDAGPNVVRAYIKRPSETAPADIFKPVTVEQAEEFKKAANPDAGAGYEAAAVELIKGGDGWFRPDDVCVAPDGAVYVTDWYDPGVGGHATNDTGTAKHGSDWHLMHGRVYRLAPSGYKPGETKLDLDSIDGQIAALNSPNFATRYLGYTRLVAELDQPQAISALKQQLAEGKKPWLRARALWLLAKSKEGPAIVEKSMADKDHRIRVTAIRAARRIGLDVTAFATDVLNDSSPAMWRELCLALRYNQSEKVMPLLVSLADKYDGVDRWYLEAFGIACTGREKAVLDAWEKGHKNQDAKNNAGITWRLKLEPVQLSAADTPPAAQASANGGALPFADDNGAAAHDASRVGHMRAVVTQNAADPGIGGFDANEASRANLSPDAGGEAGGFASVFQRRICADDAPHSTATTVKAPLPAKQFRTKDGKILPSMDDLSKLTGDPKKGAAIFRNTSAANCIKCHQIGDDGNMIGPPLTVIGGKLNKPQFYEAILYPSAAIEMGYETWVVKTKGGDVISGLKTEDTPDHITIKDTDGKYHDVDRDQIDRLVKQNISLMPEGLNETMTQQELVDLVEYLSSLKP